MKKTMCGLLVGVMTLACAPTAFAKSKITVNVDKEELVFDVEPQIINDRLMVPMRGIFERLDANVDYIASEKAVVSQKGNKTIRFVINSNNMEIKDGSTETKKIRLDAPATIIDGRTLVPARAVAESFGYQVLWDGYTKTVYINTDNSSTNGESVNTEEEKSKAIGEKLSPTEEKLKHAEESAADEESSDGIIEYYGMGEKTFENVNIPEGPYYCELYHSGGSRTLYVTLYYDEGRVFRVSNMFRQDGYAGQTFFKCDRAVSDALLEVEADGVWRIRFIPVTEKTTLRITGTGDIVTGKFTAERDKYNVYFKYAGEHNIIIKLFDLNEKEGNSKLIINEIGYYETTKEINFIVGHEYLFEILADVNGGWTIDFGVPDEKKTTYSSTTLLKKELLKKEEQK